MYNIYIYIITKIPSLILSLTSSMDVFGYHPPLLATSTHNIIPSTIIIDKPPLVNNFVNQLQLPTPTSDSNNANFSDKLNRSYAQIIKISIGKSAFKYKFEMISSYYLLVNTNLYIKTYSLKKNYNKIHVCF